MNWSHAYIGLPFRARGRDREGIDCWGLARLVYAEELGRDLPDYDGYVTARERAEIDALISGARDGGAWRPVAPGDEREFDIAVFRAGKLATHIGVLVTDRMMLHVTEGQDSALSRLDAGAWAARRIGVYRLA